MSKKDEFIAPGHKRRKTHRSITDDASGRTVEFGGRANYTRSEALKKKKGSFERMNEERKHQGHKPKTDRASKGLYGFLDKFDK